MLYTLFFVDSIRKHCFGRWPDVLPKIVCYRSLRLQVEDSKLVLGLYWYPNDLHVQNGLLCTPTPPPHDYGRTITYCLNHTLRKF
jgi:hypothetical protein